MNRITNIRDLTGRLHACGRYEHDCSKCGYAYDEDYNLVIECPLTYFGVTVVKYMDETLNWNK